MKKNCDPTRDRDVLSSIEVIKEIIRRLTGKKKSPQEILEDIRKGRIWK